MTKLIIFDLDGTLADTIESIRQALNMTMDTYGFPTLDYDTVRSIVGHGARNLIRDACPKGTFDSKDRFFEEVYAKYCDMYEMCHLQVKECYTGMKEAVLSLKEKGYALAVLSNKQDPFTRGIVAQLFPTDTFACVRGQTSLPVKPDPTAPLLIAESLGISPQESAFVGDSDVDVKTAKNAGMLSVAVTWGYRSEECLTECRPDHIAHTPDELVNFF